MKSAGNALLGSPKQVRILCGAGEARATQNPYLDTTTCATVAKTQRTVTF